MSITSSKNSFGAQLKAHIVANRAARHLRFKKFGNNKTLKKVVQSVLTDTKFSKVPVCFGVVKYEF
jgi:hypothetical protein